jgi:Antibiotic biosynthesis monooxygenase
VPDLARVLPDVARPDATTVTISQWDEQSPIDQRARADRALDDRATSPWPEGLLSTSCFLSTGPVERVGLLAETSTHDDRPGQLQVVRYEQWSSGVHDAATALDQSGVATYRLYRSHLSGDRDGSSAGPRCVVLVTIDFADDVDEPARRWVDSVIAAIEAEPEPIPGLVAGHFHLSEDRRRVVNYAEWTSEQAYDLALGSGPPGIAQTDLPEWRLVWEAPGVLANTAARYVIRGTLAPNTIS